MWHNPGLGNGWQQDTQGAEADRRGPSAAEAETDLTANSGNINGREALPLDRSA